MTPPLVLRLAVVVGGICLVLGLAGGIVVVVRGQEAADEVVDEAALDIVLVGAPASSDAVLEVRWEDHGVWLRARAVPAAVAGAWRVIGPPRGARVELRLMEAAAEGRVLWEGRATAPEEGPLLVDTRG